MIKSGILSIMEIRTVKVMEWPNEKRNRLRIRVFISVKCLHGDSREGLMLCLSFPQAKDAVALHFESQE